MKSLFIALGLAIILFLYGYLLSSAGHDHAQHEELEKHNEIIKENEGSGSVVHDQTENHDHDHH